MDTGTGSCVLAASVLCWQDMNWFCSRRHIVGFAQCQAWIPMPGVQSRLEEQLSTVDRRAVPLALVHRGKLSELGVCFPLFCFFFPCAIPSFRERKWRMGIKVCG